MTSILILVFLRQVEDYVKMEAKAGVMVPHADGWNLQMLYVARKDFPVEPTKEARL